MGKVLINTKSTGNYATWASQSRIVEELDLLSSDDALFIFAQLNLWNGFVLVTGMCWQSQFCHPCIQDYRCLGRFMNCRLEEKPSLRGAKTWRYTTSLAIRLVFLVFRSSQPWRIIFGNPLI
mgnify:FL=1